MSLAITREYLKRQLQLFNSQILDEAYLSSADIEIKKLKTASDNAISSYQLLFGDVALGDTIDIPKDYLLKSASVEVCAEEGKPESSLVVGDKYLDFVINTIDGDGNTSHIYIPLKSLFNFTAGDGIAIADEEIQVDYAKGLEIDEAQLQVKIGDSLTFDSENAIDCKFETEDIDYSDFFSTEEV